MQQAGESGAVSGGREPVAKGAEHTCGATVGVGVKREVSFTFTSRGAAEGEQWPEAAPAKGA